MTDRTEQPVSLKNLKVFVEVMRVGSISHAAVTLEQAQSAVSRAVNELERRFHGRLFLRTGRGVRPTELALDLIGSVRELLAQAEQLDETVRERAGDPSGTVALGCVPAVSAALSSALYEDLRTGFPKIRLKISEGYSGEIEDWLGAGRIDIGVLNRYRLRPQAGIRRLLVSDMMLIGRRGAIRHGAHDTLSLREVIRYPLVLPSHPNTLRALLDELGRRMNEPWRIAVEVDTPGVIKRMIAAHDLFSLLPYHAVSEELDDGRFEARRIADRALRQSVVMQASHQRPSTLATRAVMQRIPLIARRLIASGQWRGDH